MENDIVTKVISENSTLLLSTNSYGLQEVTSTNYINEEKEIYVIGLGNDNFIQQIRFNPNIVLTIDGEEANLKYYGVAELVEENPEKDKLIKKLTEKNSLIPSGIFKIELVKVKPTRIEIEEYNFSVEFPENKPSLIKEFTRSLISSVKIWMKAVRMPFIIVSVLAVLVGTATAFFEEGLFLWDRFLLTELGIITFHASADLFNDFFDHLSGNDVANEKLTPFSGGSRMIQNKLFSPIRVFTGAIICLLITITVGFYLNFTLKGNIILYIGLGGVFMGIFYVGIPFKLVHYGVGEIAIFLSFGPILVFGSYYVQLEKFSWTPIYASILVGLLISLILYINQFPDYEADKAAGKRHWVVRLGRKKASYVFIVIILLVYVILGFFVGFGLLPLLSLLALLALPFSIRAIIVVRKHHSNYLSMIPASAMTILTCIVFTILLSMGLFISFIF